MRRDVDLAVRRIALRQVGLFTRADAYGAGADRGLIARRVRAGDWIEVVPDVYRLAGGPTSWEQTLMAAVLYVGHGAVASHYAAAALYGLDGVPARPPLELTVPVRCQKRLPQPYSLHVARDLIRSDTAKLGRIPLTTPARTIIDLAAVVNDVDRLEVIYESARTKRVLDDDRLVRRLGTIRRRGKKGLTTIGTMLGRRTPEVKDSTMETLFVQLVRELGLPDPDLHVTIRDRDGNFVGEIDAGYTELRLFWELDSWRHHGGHGSFRQDRRKANRVTDLGHTLYHLTWQDLTIDRVAEGRRIVAAYERAAEGARNE